MEKQKKKVKPKKSPYLKKKVNKLSEKRINCLNSKKSVTCISSKKNYFKEISKILGFLTKNKKMNGIYISLTSPYSSFKENLKNIDVEKILFLDGVSKSLNEGIDVDNLVYLQGPTSLTEIGIILTRTFNKVEVDFVIVDSISSILNYNSEKNSLRFIQYLFGKLNNLGVKGIFIVDSEDNEKPVVKVLKDLTKKTVKI